MPDRNGRERDRAMPQRFDILTSRVRNLTLRAWQGALRTVKADWASPTSYSNYVQTLSVTVPSGRWLVHAEVTFTATAAAGDEDFYLAVDLLSPTTGAGIGVITPRRCVPAATPGGFLSIPVVLLDDFSADGDVIVSMKTKNDGGTTYSVGGPRLLVLPV